MLSKYLNNTGQPDKKQLFKEKLSNSKTMAEFLNICGEFYDLENAKLNLISKAALINNIDKIIILSGAKLK